ncbi:MAG: hypothetical protein MUC97_04875 [Bernardetiaceae bacterium]|jgi:hypothetical protein|nr:hypothetical protein [Bernardetiaceae bacterium]
MKIILSLSLSLILITACTPQSNEEIIPVVQEVIPQSDHSQLENELSSQQQAAVDLLLTYEGFSKGQEFSQTLRYNFLDRLKKMKPDELKAFKVKVLSGKKLSLESLIAEFMDVAVYREQRRALIEADQLFFSKHKELFKALGKEGFAKVHLAAKARLRSNRTASNFRTEDCYDGCTSAWESCDNSAEWGLLWSIIACGGVTYCVDAALEVYNYDLLMCHLAAVNCAVSCLSVGQ